MTVKIFPKRVVSSWFCRASLAILLLATVSYASGGGSSNSSSNSSNTGDTGPIEIDMVNLSATEAVRMMKSGAFTPTEYATALLQRAEDAEYLNALIYLDREQVLASAEAATRRLESGKPVGALIGLPLVVKDSIDTDGIPTTGGTPSLLHNVPSQNAPVLQSLLDEGAYVFAKANLAELSMAGMGANAHFGTARNPYDPARVPGGTSSGTAVAVSAGIVPLGIGEDSAGSIRSPASMTGTIGFRPTTGRYSNENILPLAHHRDTAGPMARTMNDIILLDSLVTGSSRQIGPAKLDGLRIGLPPSLWKSVDSEVMDVLEEVLRLLESHGVVLIREEIPGVRELVKNNRGADLFCVMFDDLSAYLDAHNLGIEYQQVMERVATPGVKFNMRLGLPGSIPKEDCDAALNKTRPTVQRLYAEYFAEQEVHAVVAPTLFFVPPVIGSATFTVNGDELKVRGAGLQRNLEHAAFAGLPSLTMPVGLTRKQGMPVGLLIDGPASGDSQVLAIGKAIEQIITPIPPPKIN